jgi:hypothetical protein
MSNLAPPARTIKIFNWRSKADSILTWDTYVQQHERALTSMKAIGVLNRRQVDSERKEIPDAEPVRPTLSTSAGDSVATREKKTLKYTAKMTTYRADREEYNKIISSEKDIISMHQDALNAFAESHHPDSMIMATKKKFKTEADILLARADSSIQLFGSDWKVAKLLRAEVDDEEVYNQITLVIDDYLKALDDASSVKQYRKLEDYIETTFKPGQVQQRGLIIGFLTSLRDTEDSIHAIKIRFENYIQLLETANGNPVPEVDIEMYLQSVITNKPWILYINQMMYERNFNITPRLMTWQSVFSHIISECDSDSSKDIYAKKRGADVISTGRQVIMYESESGAEQQIKKQRVSFDAQKQGGGRNQNQGGGRAQGGGRFGRGGRGGRSFPRVPGNFQNYQKQNQTVAIPSQSYVPSQQLYQSYVPPNLGYPQFVPVSSQFQYPLISHQSVPINQSYPQFQQVSGATPSVVVQDGSCFRCGNPNHSIRECSSSICSVCGMNITGLFHDARRCSNGAANRSGAGRGGDPGRGGRGFGRARRA